MQTFTKLVLITAPVAAIVLLFTLLKSNEISTRVSLQNAQTQHQINSFEKDFANFDNKTYWRNKVVKLQKKQDLELKIKHLQEELSQIQQEEKSAEESFKNGFKDNETVIKTKDLKLYPKEN